MIKEIFARMSKTLDNISDRAYRCTMNLIDAIRLYCHIMQQAGGGLEGRHAALKALLQHDVKTDVCDAIAASVANDGHLTAGNGGTFAITQLSAS